MLANNWLEYNIDMAQIIGHWSGYLMSKVEVTTSRGASRLILDFSEDL